MDKPIVADNQPLAIDLSSDETYHWCSCGRSENQPFCDGSHAGTDFEPVAFTPDKTGKAYLCLCKQTKTPPYCDGSHVDV